MVSGGLAPQGVGYAGDLTPQAAWDLLAREPAAILVDCRTRPEWSFVGTPDLSGLGKRVALIEWQSWPSMALNSEFSGQLESSISDKDAPVIFLCRSGARSKAAAVRMTALGYARCYNLDGGFEGSHDRDRHRGATSGWKAAGLPWVQE